MLIEGGANIKDVQKRLGHANIQTTLQTYVHDTEKIASDSVDIFERTAAGASPAEFARASARSFPLPAAVADLRHLPGPF